MQGKESKNALRLGDAREGEGEGGGYEESEGEIGSNFRATSEVFVNERG